MNLDDITEKLRHRLGRGGFNHKVLFDFDEDGKISVDGTQSPPVIAQEESEADVTLLTSMATFSKILDGTQDPNFAFMTGKLKIRGSMGLALKLNALLET